MTETHNHCQCDFCNGVDCGQDNPEKYAAEQTAQQEKHDAAIRAAAKAEERKRVLDAIQDHNDGRLKGLEILMATPTAERCESAQDRYLKEAYFELTLVKHLIESLRGEVQK